MKKTLKKIIASILIVSQLLGNSFVQAAEITPTNAIHVELKDGVMKITGTGKVVYEDIKPYWEEREQIREIILGEGITEFQVSFDWSASLEKVVIPKSFQSFMGYEFSNARNLKEVEYNAISASNYYNTFNGEGTPFGWSGYGEDTAKNDAAGVKVKIGDSVEKIPEALFFGANVVEINFPASIKTIDEYAFSNCHLEEIDLSQTQVKVLGERSFCANDVKSIHIPQQLQYLNAAFAECTQLEEYTVHPANRYFAALDGVLFNAAFSVLEAYPCAKQDVQYTIPGTVQTVRDFAFANCMLRELKLNDKITTVSNNMCSNSKNLKSVYLQNATVVQSFAFNQCEKLSNVNMPKVTQIGTHAFSGIQSIILPESVTSLGSWSLSGIRNVYVCGNPAPFAYYGREDESQGAPASAGYIYYLNQYEADAKQVKASYDENSYDYNMLQFVGVDDFSVLADETIENMECVTPEITLPGGSGYVYPIMKDNGLYGGPDYMSFVVEGDEKVYEAVEPEAGYFQLMDLPPYETDTTLNVTLTIEQFGVKRSKTFPIHINDKEECTYTLTGAMTKYGGITGSASVEGVKVCASYLDVSGQTIEIAEACKDHSRTVSITEQWKQGRDKQLGISLLNLDFGDLFDVSLLNYLNEQKFINYDGVTYTFTDYGEDNRDALNRILLGTAARNAGSDSLIWDGYMKLLEGESLTADKVLRGTYFMNADSTSLMNAGFQGYTMKAMVKASTQELFTEYAKDAKNIYSKAGASSSETFDAILFCPDDYVGLDPFQRTDDYCMRTLYGEQSREEDSVNELSYELNYGDHKRTYFSSGKDAVERNALLKQFLSASDGALGDDDITEAGNYILENRNDQLSYTDTMITQSSVSIPLSTGIQEINDSLGWEGGLLLEGCITKQNEYESAFRTQDGYLVISSIWSYEWKYEGHSIVGEPKKEITEEKTTKGNTTEGKQEAEAFMEHLGIESIDALIASQLTKSDTVLLTEESGLTTGNVTLKPAEAPAVHAQISYIEPSDVSRATRKQVSAYVTTKAAQDAQEKQATMTIVGDTYIVRLTDDQGEAVSTPVKAEFAYDAAWLEKLDDNVDESALCLMVYDESQNAYVKNAGETVVDTENHLVTTTISESGQYALAMDVLAPSITNVTVSAEDKTKVSAYIDDFSGIEDIILQISDTEGNVVFSTDNQDLARAYDVENNLLAYTLPEDVVLGNDAYVLTVYATDTTNRMTTSVSDFIVQKKTDLVAPVIETVQIPDTVECGKTLKISADVKDEHLAEVFARVTLVSKNNERKTGNLSLDLQHGNYTATIAGDMTERLASATLELHAIDKDGNETVSQTYTVQMTPHKYAVRYLGISDQGELYSIFGEYYEEGEKLQIPAEVIAEAGIRDYVLYKEEACVNRWDVEQDTINEDVVVYVCINRASIDIESCELVLPREVDPKAANWRSLIRINYKGYTLQENIDYDCASVDYLEDSLQMEIYGKRQFTGKVVFKIPYVSSASETYQIIFHANGGTGVMASMENCIYGQEYRLPQNLFVREGYVFAGWNLGLAASGKIYQAGDSFKRYSREDKEKVMFYACWKPIRYAITYKLNGGTNAGTNPADYSSDTQDIFFAKPKKTGYTFKGWYSDSKYKQKISGIPKGSAGDKVVYAKWAANTYTIKFHANGGKGSMAKMKKRVYGKKYKLPSNKYTRKGYTFAGWSTKKKGSKKIYRNKASVKNLVSKNGGSITLYAQWSRKHLR